MAFWTYVLVNEGGETYVGQTGDLERRLAEHNGNRPSDTLHTKRHKGPWAKLYSKEYATRAEAMKREKQLKTGAGREFIKQLLKQRNVKESGC